MKVTRYDRWGRLVPACFAAGALVLSACTSGGSASDSTDNDGSGSGSESNGETIKATIGIANIAPVTALELVEEGFEEGMEQCAPVDAELDFKNAEGDGAQLGPILTGFVDSDVDLIMAIATPVLQEAVSVNEAAGGNIPVIFAAVTNPYEAGAADGPEDKPDWLTGWQADSPVDGMFDIAEEINPDGKTIGVAYDASQVNSELNIEKLEEEAKKRGNGWTIETATIADSNEVGQAATTLAGRDVDFFFAITDSILISGLSGMVQVAEDSDIPIIAQDANSVSEGAAIGVGLDYRADGVRSAEYACEILQGNTTPADYPILQADEDLVKYSVEAAEAQGFEIPQSVLDDGVEQE